MDGGKQTNKTNIGRWRVEGVKYMRPSLKATRVINILLDSRHSSPLSVLIIAEQYNYLAAELTEAIFAVRQFEAQISWLLPGNY